MTGYRRNFIARGSFFFTVNLAERRLRLLTQHIDELRTAFRETRRHHPFAIDAMVVLPDHLHTIWTLSFLGIESPSRGHRHGNLGRAV